MRGECSAFAFSLFRLIFQTTFANMAYIRVRLPAAPFRSGQALQPHRSSDASQFQPGKHRYRGEFARAVAVAIYLATVIAPSSARTLQYRTYVVPRPDDNVQGNCEYQLTIPNAENPVDGVLGLAPRWEWTRLNFQRRRGYGPPPESKFQIPLQLCPNCAQQLHKRRLTTAQSVTATIRKWL